jgi:succinate dehydrogenase / fumarate reductase, cytochrome b subunit
MPTRPLSPHLSVYRMSRYTLATSIFNRFTGVALSCALVLLIYWLMAACAGPAAFARAASVLGSVPARLIYLALIVSFSYHLLAGIRHLVWDTGRGLERAQSRTSAYLVVTLSVLLVLLIAYCAYLSGTRAP